MKKKTVIFIFIFCLALILGGCKIIYPSTSEIPVAKNVVEGDTLLAAGKYDEAIESYSGFLQNSHGSADVYLSMGKAYFFSAQYVLAVESLTESIGLDKNNSDVYYYRAWAHMANGAIDRANADFNSVIAFKPAFPGAYNGRQWCNANIAQWDQSSLLYLYQKFESDAGLTAAYEGLSWDFVKEMQWDLAVAPVPSTAVRENPNVSDAYCNLGFACFKKAQWAAAIRDMERAYMLNPELNRSNWNIDWAKGKSNSWESVIKDNSQIIQIIGDAAVKSEFTSSDNTPLGWKNTALKCYAEASQKSRDSQAVRVSADAIDFIKAWGQKLNLPD